MHRADCHNNSVFIKASSYTKIRSDYLMKFQDIIHIYASLLHCYSSSR